MFHKKHLTTGTIGKCTLHEYTLIARMRNQLHTSVWPCWPAWRSHQWRPSACISSSACDRRAGRGGGGQVL